VTVLRCGWFYEPDGAFTRTIAENLLNGDMPIIGRGLLGRRDAELSLVHALTTLRGRSQTPSRRRSLDSTTSSTTNASPSGVSHRLRRPARRAGSEPDARVARPILRRDGDGEHADEADAHVREPLQGKRPAGEPTYPTYREGLDHLIETWEADGTLAELQGERVDGSDAKRAPESAA